MEYLDPFLPSANPLILFFLISAFLVAGIIKGFLGMGLPTTVMALLTLVMEPTAAIPLLTIPIFVTNFAQYIRSSNPLKVAKNYKYFSVSIMISILITSMFITSYPQSLLTMTIGFAMVIFSAALRGIPEESLEAARIDGANEIQIFFRIMIPQILVTIMVVWTTITIIVLKIFDIVLAMTNGQWNTEVLANLMFDWMFRGGGDSGRGSVIALMIMIAVIPIMIWNIRNFRREEEGR